MPTPSTMRPAAVLLALGAVVLSTPQANASVPPLYQATSLEPHGRSKRTVSGCRRHPFHHPPTPRDGGALVASFPDGGSALTHALRIRGGSGYGGSSLSAESDDAAVEEGRQEIQELIENLSVVVRERRSGDGGGGGVSDGGGETSEDEEARLWRRLGRRLLDSGERAESARVFRYGAGRCPRDGGLGHHLRVFEAFHGTTGEDGEDEGERDEEKNNEGDGKEVDAATPPRPPDGASLLRDDPSLLVTLDVPPRSVPRSALEACPSYSSDAFSLRSSLSRRLVHATSKPVISRDACSFLISAARDAARRRGGYTTDRHVHAPTCDVPSFDLERTASTWVRDALLSTLIPILGGVFPTEMDVRAEDVRVQDCFVVRYDGSESEPGFASLRPHEDESLLSITVALNDMAEYEGGGLFIAATGDLLNGDAGTLMCFAGGLEHGGYPVQRGTRWILTAFLYLERNDSGRGAGYVLDEISGQRGHGVPKDYSR